MATWSSNCGFCCQGHAKKMKKKRGRKRNIIVGRKQRGMDTTVSTAVMKTLTSLYILNHVLQSTMPYIMMGRSTQRIQWCTIVLVASIGTMFQYMGAFVILSEGINYCKQHSHVVLPCAGGAVLKTCAFPLLSMAKSWWVSRRSRVRYYILFSDEICSRQPLKN
jgi:hypothetical protein